MIRPAQSHAALLADIRAADQRDGGFRLWWLGQSGFLLQWQGIHVLLDPYLSDSSDAKIQHDRQAACADDGTSH